MKSPSRRFLFIAAMAVASIGANAGYAYTITTPAGLSPGDHFYMVFVTADSTDATSTDLATYDTFAQSEAAAGGTDMYGSEGITWKALGSTDSQDAVSRFNPGNVPIYLVDGTPVANSTDKIWSGSLLNPIDINSSGASEASTNVWTGTASDGTEATVTVPYPVKGTITFPMGLGDPSAEYGNSSATNAQWVASSSEVPVDTSGISPVTNELPIYAFSSELTVPGGTTVPLPSAAEMTAAGAMLLALQALAARLKSRVL